MARKKLVVHRKGYRRESYVKDVKPGPGVVRRRIKGAYVDPATYKTVDKGEPGRTPKSNRWLKAKPEMKGALGEGYVRLPASKRHARLRAADRKKNISSQELWHHTGGLRNVSTSRKAKQVFAQDQNWIEKNLLDKKEARSLTSAPRRKWKNMSAKEREKAMPDHMLDESKKVLRCRYCNHKWNPRVRDPERCPKCNKKFR